MTRLAAAVAVLAAGAVLLAVLATAAVLGRPPVALLLGGTCGPGLSAASTTPGGPTRGSAPAGLTAEQAANARIIIAVGKARGVPRRGWIIAIATSLQEARLLNYANSSVPVSLTYPHQAVGSDHDSVGLFQQRRASGWGSIKELMNPYYAARAFYGGPDVPPANRGLLDIPGWQRMPVTVAAQTVQVSAFPDAYADDAARAARIVSSLASTTPPAEGIDPARTRPRRDPGQLGRCAYVDRLGPGVTRLAQLSPGRWVAPVTGTLTSGFGARWAGFHDGTDIAGPIGTPVVAASSGVVIDAGPASGYGLWVRILHAGGIVTEYGHLHAVTVAEGQRVRAGQVIATRGNRGQSTGPHLHFEVHVNASRRDPVGKSVDAMSFYRAKGVPLVIDARGAA